MRDRDRNREEQLERLFAESRAWLPELEADPALPARIRALAARAASDRRPAKRRGWAWISLAGATVAMSIVTGGYVGYRLWSGSQEAAAEQIGDAGALAQAGLADDLAGDEVGE